MKKQTIFRKKHEAGNKQKMQGNEVLYKEALRLWKNIKVGKVIKGNIVIFKSSTLLVLQSDKGKKFSYNINDFFVLYANRGVT